jgi:beta-lactamase superfamily II metal-dependent hydrolase
MKRTVLSTIFLSLVVLSVVHVEGAESKRRPLDIYFIDVEGGAATLIVTPAGESVLVDAGWPGFEGRDAKRIKRAMDRAGIEAIDHLVATHYHKDHYGGIAELAKLVPIRRFYDHGRMASLAEDASFSDLYSAYQTAARGQTITLKPGDLIPLKRAGGTPPVKLVCLAARGELLSGKPRPNPECSSAVAKEEDTTDNARSIALLLTFGNFEFLDCGDLTWNVEERLVCPTDRIGPVDLYQVTHHGMNNSNNPVLLRTVQPTVAVMNNGPRKGGHPDTVKWLLQLPSLHVFYQLHRNEGTKPEENAPEDFVANLSEQQDAAHSIWVSVDAERFTVTNDRTGEGRGFPLK